MSRSCRPDPVDRAVNSHQPKEDTCPPSSPTSSRATSNRRRRHSHRRRRGAPRHGRDPGLADRRSLEIHLHDRDHRRRSTWSRPLRRLGSPDRQLPRRHRRPQMGLHHRRPTHHAAHHRPIAARRTTAQHAERRRTRPRQQLKRRSRSIVSPGELGLERRAWEVPPELTGFCTDALNTVDSHR